MTGNTTSYTYGLTVSPQLHTVWLTGLPLNSTIFYVLGDAATGQTAEATFRSSPGVGSGPAFYPYTTAFLADVGESANAEATVAHVASSLAAGVDSVVVAGDLSYASGCELLACDNWNAFGRMMQPVAAAVPTAINLGVRA